MPMCTWVTKDVVEVMLSGKPTTLECNRNCEIVATSTGVLLQNEYDVCIEACEGDWSIRVGEPITVKAGIIFAEPQLMEGTGKWEFSEASPAQSVPVLQPAEVAIPIIRLTACTPAASDNCPVLSSSASNALEAIEVQVCENIHIDLGKSIKLGAIERATFLWELVSADMEVACGTDGQNEDCSKAGFTKAKVSKILEDAQEYQPATDIRFESKQLEPDFVYSFNVKVESQWTDDQNNPMVGDLNFIITKMGYPEPTMVVDKAPAMDMTQPKDLINLRAKCAQSPCSVDDERPIPSYEWQFLGAKDVQYNSEVDAVGNPVDVQEVADVTQGSLTCASGSQGNKCIKKAHWTGEVLAIPPYTLKSPGSSPEAQDFRYRSYTFQVTCRVGSQEKASTFHINIERDNLVAVIEPSGQKMSKSQTIAVDLSCSFDPDIGSSEDNCVDQETQVLIPNAEYLFMCYTEADGLPCTMGIEDFEVGKEIDCRLAELDYEADPWQFVTDCQISMAQGYCPCIFSEQTGTIPDNERCEAVERGGGSVNSFSRNSRIYTLPKFPTPEDGVFPIFQSCLSSPGVAMINSQLLLAEKTYVFVGFVKQGNRGAYSTGVAYEITDAFIPSCTLSKPRDVFRRSTSPKNGMYGFLWGITIGGQCRRDRNDQESFGSLEYEWTIQERPGGTQLPFEYPKLCEMHCEAIQNICGDCIKELNCLGWTVGAYDEQG